MLGLSNKDMLYRLLLLVTVDKKISRKYFLSSITLGRFYRTQARLNLKFFTVAKSFIKNKCLSTLRSRSVYRILKISRIEIRKVIKLYRIVGMKKGGW